MTELRIDSDIRLIPYYRNDSASLPWYQDLDVCRQVDDRGVLVGDVSLRDSGEIAIVVCKEYQNRHIGRRCVSELLKLAAEKGMAQVTANIYAFNHQSQRMFLAIGFEKTGEEWYTYRLTLETEE